MNFIRLLLFCLPIYAFSINVEIVPSCKNELSYKFLTEDEQNDERRSGWDRAWGRFADNIIEGDGHISFTDLSDVPKKRKNWKKHVSWLELKKETDLIIAWGMPHFIHARKFSNIPREKQVLFLLEPPTVIPSQYEQKATKYFRKIFTWQDDLVDNEIYFKFYHPVLRPAIEREVPFQQKKFFCMIVANKSSDHPDELYSKRRAIIDYFETRQTFDLFGRGWQDENLNNYHGEVDDKIIKASEYKFAFCLENMGNVEGYITEKIFDAFSSLTVPIYEGATNIGDEIPSGCFINLKDYGSMDELHEKLLIMSKEEYEGYIRNIRAFLSSQEAYKFSADAFFRILESEISS